MRVCVSFKYATHLTNKCDKRTITKRKSLLYYSIYHWPHNFSSGYNLGRYSVTIVCLQLNESYLI